MTQIPVKYYAASHHETEESVISKIKDGQLSGFCKDGEWHVDVTNSSDSSRDANSQTGSAKKAAGQSPYDKAFFVVFFAGVVAMIYFIYKLSTCSFMPPGSERVSLSSRDTAENRAYVDCRGRWAPLYRDQGFSFWDSMEKAHGHCYHLK